MSKTQARTLWGFFFRTVSGLRLASWSDLHPFLGFKLSQAQANLLHQVGTVSRLACGRWLHLNTAVHSRIEIAQIYSPQ